MLFNDHKKTIYSHVPVKDVPELTKDVYKPDEGTALMDALGDSITKMKKYIESLADDQKPGYVSIFI